jgi:dTDP-4-amino-4,6-dideoxygalactose transaminase
MTEMIIPFGTVSISPKSVSLVNECLKSGRLSSGRLVREFEEKFADLIGVKEAVTVGSGTDADCLALAVLHDYGAKRGDEIIIPALTFVATGNAVLHAGFTPVFVDVDPLTLNIDPQKIEEKISDRTRAIMPVHLMGKPAPMDEIFEIANKHNLLVIDDAAEAFGGVYKNNNIGTLGDMSAYSLYVAHIITSGEGGVITTDNEDYAEIIRSLRSHGRACKCKKCVSNITSGYCEKRFKDRERGDIRFIFERVGFSCKMNELEAAIGLGTLDSYHEIVDKRHRNLISAIDHFQNFTEYFDTFTEEPYEKIGPHAFPFILKDDLPFSRNELMLHLEKSGIDARTLFSSIPTQCGGYEFLGYEKGDFPHSEYIGENGIHIGIHQDIGENEIQYFVECIDKFLSEYS